MRISQSKSFVAALVMLLAWGVLAFGGVYEWAYRPILIAAPVLGLWGARLAMTRAGAPPITSRPMALGLAALAAAVAVQLIPLPRGVLGILSPATVDFLGQAYLVFPQAPGAHPLSINPRATATALAFVIALGILLLGVSSALQATGTRRIAVCIVFLALFVAVVGLLQRAFGDYRIYGFWTPLQGRQPFGPFVNRNHFAGWMVMAFGLSLGYFGGRIEMAMRGVGPGWRNKLSWLSSPGASQTVLLAAGLLLMAASIVLTTSRSGAGAMGMAMMAFAVAALRGGAGLARWLTVVVLLAVMVTGLAAWANMDALGQRFAKREWMEPTGRFGAWSDTIRVTQDFWLTGTGLNTFADAMLVYQRRPGLHLVHAHSDYLQLLSEGGLLLGIPVLVVTGIAIRQVRRRFREGLDDPMTSWIRTGAVAALAGIALQEMAEGSLQMPGNALLFTVIMAIAIHKRPSSGRTAQHDMSTRGAQGAR